MSYFFAGKKEYLGHEDQFESLLEKSAFVNISKKKMEVTTADSFARCYEPPKIIEDLLITLPDSWLLLTGAPAVDIKTDTEKKEFAEAFFKDPISILRHQIDGHFALLAFDGGTKSFFAASDWHNLIPVYYTITTGGPLFCSTELFLAKTLNSEPDEFGFAQAVQYGAVWGSRTRFSNINKLDPCELIRIDGKHALHRERYWTPDQESLWSGTFDQVTDKWSGIMQDAIRVFTDRRGNAEVTSDLTGGEDSRLVVSLLHKLGLPFRARVAGETDDADIRIAQEAARKTGIDLAVHINRPINDDELETHAKRIAIGSDAYGSFFSKCSSFVLELDYPPNEYKTIHLCGFPGGGEFRGGYYPRAGLLFPSRSKSIDARAFTRRRFLLDFPANLLSMADNEYCERVYKIMDETLEDVRDFPAGIQVDHLMRVRQYSLVNVHMKRPFYYAFAGKELTRSIYCVPPHMKQGGRQTKAITEMLFPEIAWVKTQAGVPTVRKSLLRAPLFFPEHLALIKKASLGAARQIYKSSVFTSKGTLNARHHVLSFHINSIQWLFRNEPYASWLKSPDQMLTAKYYNPESLQILLTQAQQPTFNQVQLLGRIINQEIAFRYVYEGDRFWS